MNIIEKIRKDIKENIDSPYYGGMEVTAETIRELSYSDKAEIVSSTTEDRGGRWTKWEVRVFKVFIGDEVAYFKVEEEVGATEVQSDGDTIVREVKPKEITTIEYVLCNE